jgi:hypothetical protein
MSKIDKLHPHSGRYMDELDQVRNIIERVTGAPRAISSDHASIHAGEGFSISGIITNLANGASTNYAFKTPTIASGKVVHWKYRDVQSSANKIRVDFVEAPTNAPTLGTDLVAYNRSRLSSHGTAMQTIKAGTTYDGTGAKTIDSAQYVGGQPRSLDIEFVLKPDTWYVVLITNSTGSAVDVSFFDFWYEESMG